MNPRRIGGAIAGLLTAFCLGACVASNPPTVDGEAIYAERQGEIPQLSRSISAPHLSVLLGGLQLQGQSPQLWDAEKTGSSRATEQQAMKDLQIMKVEPSICKEKIEDTYHDHYEIPAAFSQLNDTKNLGVVRIQLRGYPTTQAASAAIQSQRDLATECPSYQVAYPSIEPVSYLMKVVDYPLEGATDGILTLTSVNGANAEAAVFQRVGNLELRVYFDGADPETSALACVSDLQEFVKHMGIALLTKGQ